MKHIDASFFADVAARFDSAADVVSTLNCVAECARDVTESAEAGVIVMGRGRTISSAATTSPLVRQAELLHAECGEGPSLIAISTGESLISGELGCDDRWPLWGLRVAEFGLHSVLSVRLHARGRVIGSLNLYSEESDAFGAVELEVATVLSRHAAIALATAWQEDGLQKAMNAHTVVGQAQGVLMEKYGLSAEGAFDALRRSSQNQNLKLRSLAETVVARRILPDMELIGSARSR